MTITGSSTLALNVANTYSGDTRVSSGTLVIGNPNALQNSTLDLNASDNGGAGWGSGVTSLTLGGLKGTRDWSMDTVAVSIGNNNQDTAYSGRLIGTMSVIKIGSGALTLSGNNAYSGGTTLSAGQLNINNGGSSSANSAIGTGTFTISGGTIDNTSSGDLTLAPNNAQNWNDDFTYAGSSHSLNLGSGAVTLSANRQVTVSANALTVGGVISGSGKALTKAGNGTLTLANANTFTGGVTLNAGTLNINNASALGTVAGTFTIAGGTIDNSSSAAITTVNYPQAWNGDFAFTGTKDRTSAPAQSRPVPVARSPSMAATLQWVASLAAVRSV